ncbi:hypothetical protein OAK75_07990 [Bacteriovoracales bacterium]|nr:hypothetical protein [Bacteriovoracales bacterium]
MSIRLLLLLGVLITTFSTQAYYGRYSTEATLTFSGKIEVFKKGKLTLTKVKRDHRVKKLIRLQVDHLTGYFQSESFSKKNKLKGILGDDYNFSINKIEKGKLKNQYFLSYDFNGKTSFEKKIFKNRKKIKIPLRLPINPKTVYKKSLKRGKNPCTDEYYNAEEDFFYFWDPYKKGCSLAKDFKNVPKIKAVLTPIKNTRWSYPEYDKLFGDNGNGKDLEIYIFVGYMDKLKTLDYPNKKDESYSTYKKIKSGLKRKGLKLINEEKDFRLDGDEDDIYDGANILSEFTKKVKFNGKTANVKIKLLLTDTNINSEDETFHYYYKKALKTADIIEYEGHSGLGANLSLKDLEINRLNKRKYQLIFFNACSTYKYFNEEYIKAKGGTKNLDIILSGLPTYSDSAANNSLAFLRTFLDAKALTFQTIISRLEDSSNDGPFLYSVVGDEDNSWEPR